MTTPSLISLNLVVWRQKNAVDAGGFESHHVADIPTDISFLEMLDMLNDILIRKGKPAISFDHDCREGICGSCGAVVNGRPHGPIPDTTLCQLYMREFNDGDTLVVEPFRARAFRVIKDLVVDRSPLDRIIQAGGYISVRAGSAPDANGIPVSRKDAETAFASAACIGCGACVAACPNAAAMLFAGAKVSHLATLPQGRPEAAMRVLKMVAAMDAEGFGHCANARECEVECPKGIDIRNIAKMNREFLKAGMR